MSAENHAGGGAVIGPQRRRTSRISIVFAAVGMLAGLGAWGVFAWLISGGASVREDPNRVFAVFFWYFVGGPGLVLLGLAFSIVACLVPRRSGRLASLALLVDLSLPMLLLVEARAGTTEAWWFLGWMGVNTAVGILVTSALGWAARRRGWPVAALRAGFAATAAVTVFLILGGLVFLAL